MELRRLFARGMGCLALGVATPALADPAPVPDHWDRVHASGKLQAEVGLFGLGVGGAVLVVAGGTGFAASRSGPVPYTGEGWAVTVLVGAVLVAAGPPVAAAGSLRMRRGAVKRGFQVGDGYGVASWACWGGALFALAVDQADGEAAELSTLAVPAFAGSYVFAILQTYAMNPTRKEFQVGPLVSATRHGEPVLGVGGRF